MVSLKGYNMFLLKKGLFGLLIFLILFIQAAPHFVWFVFPTAFFHFYGMVCVFMESHPLPVFRRN